MPGSARDAMMVTEKSGTTRTSTMITSWMRTFATNVKGTSALGGVFLITREPLDMQKPVEAAMIVQVVYGMSKMKSILSIWRQSLCVISAKSIVVLQKA